MLKKEHRLAKTKDVKVVVSSGRSFFDPLFTLKRLAGRLGVKRFTVVVSTKVSKKAVTRNKIKRVLRESIRGNFARFPDGDYALLVRPAAGKVEPKVLRQKFEDMTNLALKKISK